MREVAEEGNADAQYLLAICLYQGVGVMTDEKEGTKWLKRAAKQGQRDAKKLVFKQRKQLAKAILGGVIDGFFAGLLGGDDSPMPVVVVSSDGRYATLEYRY
uniref:Uncharacterized protein n=1 Tax=Vannella robusta TaxID=1487602 RepID=A0A7S4HZY0_9EUKA